MGDAAVARPNLPQFEPDYDFYKMRTLVDELNRWIDTVESGESGAGSGGGTGTGVHNDLTGRDAADAHPITAITGLTATLAGLSSSIATNTANIAFNAAGIASNTAAIGVNTIAIAANAAAIAAHLADLANPHSDTLQQAYDEDATVPQITINATPDPFTIDASVAGDIFALRDAANADVVRFSTTGSLVHGGINATNILAFRGSSDADLGILHFDSPMIIDFDYTLTPTTQVMTYNPTIPSSGLAVTSFILVQPAITIDSGLFIASTVRDIGEYDQVVAPGFAVQTVFLGQPNMLTTTALVQPNQTFMFASQAQYENDGAGAVAAHISNIIGMTHLPQLIARVAGDTLSATNITGIQCGAAFSTVAGTTINFGTIRGVHMTNPAQGIFQPGAGVEGMDALIGLDVLAIPFGGNVTKRAVRSALVAATNARFLENLSTAASEFGTSVAHFNDSGVIQFGGALNAADMSFFWNGGGGFMEFFFFSTFDFLQWSSPAADRFLFDNNTGSTAGEYNWNCHKFSLGASTGAVGNQVGTFVTPARTAAVPGGWADFLLTQGGNLNLGVLAMSDVSAWVINAISFDNTAYTITELATLRVGGMTTSNPGGTVTERAALWVRGRHMQEGSWQTEPITPAALNSGNNNDWAGLLTGSPSNNTRLWARIQGNATTSVITGIDATAVQDGDTFELTNVSANAIDITDQDAASVAANRIITPSGATYVLGADETVWTKYDATTVRWRLLAGTGA